MKYKKLLTILYILFLCGSYFVVKSTLNDTSVDVRKEQQPRKGEKERLVNVTLAIPELDKTYRVKLKNLDTVNTLLENIRKDETTGFAYERTDFIRELELCCVNGTVSPWAVFQNEEDITQRIDFTTLREDDIFVMKSL